jgi:uronate dehydrogenase
MLVLITGAAGRIGTMVRPRLRAEGVSLRLMDVVAPTDLQDGEETIVGSVTDRRVLTDAMHGVEAVVHLAGIAVEAAWDDILDANVTGTQSVLQSAVDAGVARLVLASSNHAAGFWTRSEAAERGLLADVATRPDTFYGWSKAAGEALARLYHDRFGIDVVALRIGSSSAEPPDVRALSTWLSPRDTAELIWVALRDPRAAGFHIVWGVSANTRRWWSSAEGEAIGYTPKDDAEAYAAALLADAVWDTTDPTLFLVGGSFCRSPLGEPM